ncbi:MAG: PspC domain-containing protein [Bacillota bacterium]|nr:PspC domain-containing protein [Bacillota bacterium]
MNNRVYRSHSNKVIAGVAGGLAEYFDVDVVLVRLLWVVAGFAGGGILAYIIAWIVIPERDSIVNRKENIYSQNHEMETEPESVIEETEKTTSGQGTEQVRARRQRIFGLFLIGFGIIFLARQFLGIFFHSFWPVLLIILGVFLLIRDRKGAGWWR